MRLPLLLFVELTIIFNFIGHTGDFSPLFFQSNYLRRTGKMEKKKYMYCLIASDSKPALLL